MALGGYPIRAPWTRHPAAVSPALCHQPMKPDAKAVPDGSYGHERDIR
eukprot:CAMPEP_0171254994 /NCGR_PEP_ID=MMETSP0790-20130122/52529_1 /TAXON_ID=2925 /ORGANISM="Alexandrium catenella, Strain OF101" /LENGTH=47 /DNA_ID= /DNA_START= /DNA_END= /DNA_ORIENTATION=